MSFTHSQSGVIFSIVAAVNIYLLVCFDQLVESKQAAVPATAALGLQVHADLVHDGSPAAREVVSDDGSQTHS